MQEPLHATAASENLGARDMCSDMRAARRESAGGARGHDSVGRLAVWPPLSPAVYSRRPAQDLPFPLDQPGCVLFSRGRHAISHGIRALGLPPGAVVLVPAYHCGTEIEALVGAGVECRFYGGSASLEPDENELAQLLDERVAALYVTHYLGFPQDVLRWRRWCDAHDVLLIEDVAQGWFGTIDGRPIGSLGDLSIFTFYKTLGLPDGAALLCRDGLDGLARRGALRLGMVGIRHAEWLMARSALLTELDDRWRPALKRVRRGVDPATGVDAVGNLDCPPARATRFLLPRLVDATIAERRRQNYERLLMELGDVVANPFARLPAGACPWAFMVDAEDKRSLMNRLLHHRIRAIDFWHTPHPSLPAHRFPQASALRARLVGIPVHQELRECDLARLGPAVRDALEQDRKAK
ncbi:MAG: DegT/DnrJ/EryC1/StrS family aminotransferase [Solirubrobacteraceae bacterium]